MTKKEEVSIFYLIHKIKIQKSLIEAFLIGLEEIDNDAILSYHENTLGEWLYDYALIELPNFQEINILEKENKQINFLEKKIIELKKIGRIFDAKQEFKNYTELVSQVVIKLQSVNQKTTRK